MEIVDHSQEFIEEKNRKIETALMLIGLTAERYAKCLCPVDTGRLRNSITHEVVTGEEAVYVGTNVEYAPYVELGTSRQTAQPYLRPAATDHVDEYTDIVKRVLKGEF
jgi:HK97 gp10 family phage protein